MTPVTDLLTENHLAPLLSVLVVYGLALVPLLGLILLSAWATVANRRLARCEARAADALGELRAGPAVLEGTIQIQDGERPPVRVEIDQLLAESGNVRQWQETARRMEARPFELHLRSGESVSVQPDDHVVLASEVSAIGEVQPELRTRVAELVDGQQIHVAGVLVAGQGSAQQGGGDYRRAPRRGWALRSAPGRRLVVSSKPLRARFDEQAKFWWGWVRILVVLLVLVHGLLLVRFHVRSLVGRAVSAQVQKLATYTTKGSEGDTHLHFRVQARLLDRPSRMLVLDVERETFDRLHQGQTIMVRVVSWSTWFDQAGAAPTVPLVSGGLVLLLVLGTAFVVVGSARYTRTWYEGGRLDEPFEGSPPGAPDAPTRIASS